MSSESSTSTRAVEVVPGSDGAGSVAGGGCVGAGGFSGPPPSAATETASANTNAIANRRLFIPGLPPFSEADERGSIAANHPDALSYFEQFWALRCAGDYAAALAVCDELLEVIDPLDYASHLRQTNARAMALRDLKRFRESKYAQLAGRPFLVAVPDLTLTGDHFHGLGITLTELSDYVRAYKALDEARRRYLKAGEDGRAYHTDINVARLYARAGRPQSAHELLDALIPSADAQIARALAFEKEGDKVGARRAIAGALCLLADSSNEATRAEALEVMQRIEGKASARA